MKHQYDDDEYSAPVATLRSKLNNKTNLKEREPALVCGFQFPAKRAGLGEEGEKVWEGLGGWGVMNALWS